MHLSLSWRRHWKLAVGSAGVLTVLVFALGNVRLAGNAGEGGHPRKGDIAGTADLFDETSIHTIEVTFDTAEYEAALAAFADDGDKGFIEADLVIDGTVVQDVGIRLKGNSTLFRLATEGDVGEVAERPGEALAGGPPGFAAAASPEGLPWLIRFDEFLDGQTYQSHREVAVRPSGGSVSRATALNEALSLSLIDLAGEAAPAAAYASFSVNGSEPVLRLIVQEPGDSLVEDDFAGDGVLYKALSGTSGGRFTYLGENPLDYARSFRQVTWSSGLGLGPLIEFIRWVEESSDEEFTSDLGNRLEVESLARYLALHNLLLDADDMTGPGQNYYLHYGPRTEHFVVVTWDANATFAGDAARGPYDSGIIWEPGITPFPPEEGSAGDFPPAPQGASPEGVEPPEGTQPLGAGEPSDDLGESWMAWPGETPAQPGGAERHILKDRFLEMPEFRAVYEQAYRALYLMLFADGAALRELERWATALSSVEGDLIESATLIDEIAALRRIIELRTAALAANPVIAGS